MARYYSRLSRIEERKNRRSVFVFIIATVALVVFILNYGIPLVAKVTNFIAESAGRESVFEAADSTPPAPPRIDPLPEYTNNSRLIVKGNAEPESKVILSLNGKDKEVITDIDGDFSSSFSLTKDKNTLSAKAIDKNNNESKQSKSYIIYYDITDPEIKVTSPQDGQSFFGNDKQITIEGETEEHAHLTINDRVIVVGSNGKFSQTFGLSEGENNLNFLAIDQAGNESELSLTVNYSP